ncbi:MAG: twin-arginine translocase subunit TatC [Planctomycetota bacterium]
MPTPQQRPALDQLDVMDGGVMPLGDHLEELRKRLMLVIFGLVPFFVLALVVGQPVLEFLIRPLQAALRDKGLAASIQNTGPYEAFGSYIKIAIILTILGGSWWVLTQLWLFVRPGLYQTERRFVYILIPLSVVMTGLGVTFMYTVMLPVVLSFFIGFGSSLGATPAETVQVPPGIVLAEVPVLEGDPPNPSVGQSWINSELKQWRVCTEIKPDGTPVILTSTLQAASAGLEQSYRLREYVGLVLMLSLGFAVGFQMPVVVLLLGWAGIVEPKDLTGIRKYMLMGCLVASSILTPADPLSMVLLAGPLYVLYELGLILLRLMPARALTGDDGDA